MINQSKLQATVCNFSKAREKLHVQGVIGFDFVLLSEKLV